MFCAVSAFGQESERQGILLVAQTKLSDPNFNKTVVLITQHGKAGTVGVILNRPTRVLLSKVFPESKVLSESDSHLFGGGPVSANSLVFLYRSSRKNKHALSVFGDVYLSANMQLLGAQLTESGTENVRVFAGFAGWAPGQLDREIARGDWIMTEASLNRVFAKDTEKLWQEMMRTLDGQLVKRSPAKDLRQRLPTVAG